MAGDPGVSVELLHGFGSHCDKGLRDAALFGDDSGHTVVYPIGRHVAISNTDTGETSFVSEGDEGRDAISACAVSRDHTYLAVSEKLSGHAAISVYSLREHIWGLRPERTLRAFGSPVARIAGVAFSPLASALGSSHASSHSPTLSRGGSSMVVPRSSKATLMRQEDRNAAAVNLLCIIATSPEISVIVIDWRTDKVLGRCRLEAHIDRVNFSPHDFNHISISGPHCLRSLVLKDVASKIRDSSLRLMPAFEGLTEATIRLVDHAWVEPGDGRIVACTSEGPVYILSTQELKVLNIIATAFPDAAGHAMTTPACIRCFSAGFLVGGGQGRVTVWERVESFDEEDAASEAALRGFQHAHTIRVRRTESAACHLDITGTEESLLVGFRDASIGLLPMSSFSAHGVESVDCALVSGGFHSGPIAGLDIAVQRPLVLSMCRKDCSVRVWNFATKNCELYWKSPPGDPPTGAALHPFGYFAAIGLAERLCFFYVLEKELRLYCEFPIRAARLLRFAHGGHLFAAAQENTVHIFSTRLVTPVATLDCKQKVTALCFDPDDHALWTCSLDGEVREWDTQTWTSDEAGARPCEFLDISSNATGQACCSMVQSAKCSLRKIKNGSVESEMGLHGVSTLRVNALCHSSAGGVMFAATSIGYLRTYAASSFSELALHTGACTQVCLSVDGRTLVTAGDDGAIFVLAVSGLAPGEEGGPGAQGKPGGAAEGQTAGATGGEVEVRTLSAEVLLVNRSEIQKQQDESRRLRAENGKLSAQLLGEAAKLEVECRARVDEARKKDRAEIAELERRCNALEHASIAKERESKRIRQSMEAAHIQAADQLKHLYEKKREYEADRFVQQELELERMQAECKAAEEQIKRDLERDRERGRQELERRLAEKDLEIQKHKDLIAFAQDRFEHLLGQEANDHDSEVADVQLTGHQQLQEQSHVELKLKTEQEELYRGLELMEKDRERIENQQQEATNAIKSLRDQKDELERTHKSLTAEKRERIHTLKDKEQKIEGYKEKVNTLKKFKSLLDQRLAEVAQSLQPKDKMIDQLTRHLKELEAEFERQLAEQRAVEGQIELKKQQASFLTAETMDTRQEIKDKERMIAAYTNDLHNLLKGGLDQRLWPAEIRRIYHAHACGETNAKEERLPAEEMMRQMRQVERKVSALSFKSSQTKAVCKADMQRKAHENATLVFELNELRVMKRSLQRQIKELKARQAEQQGASPPQLPPAALEDSQDRTKRPASASGSASASGRPASRPLAAPSPSSAPRAPSSADGPPGPRQQSGSGRATPELPAASRTRSVPPLRAGAGGRSGRPANEQRRMNSLQATSELHREELRLQQHENRSLRAQIDQLMDQRGLA